MTSKAFVKDDWIRDGINLAVTREGGGGRHVIVWGAQPLTLRTVTQDSARHEPDPDEWLSMSLEDARAIYEALADFLGHGGNDTRALRRDYDDERKRVDKLIAHVTGQPA